MTCIGTEPARLLDELKRVAVEQLAAVPAELYRPIEEHLQNALRLNQPGARRKDLMTVLALRQRGAGQAMRYRELIAHSFDDFRSRALAGSSGMPLGLVDDSELQFHLAGQHLAEAIGQRYVQPLKTLDLRFEALSAALGASATSNPVGATRLAGAFLQLFRDAELSETLQPLLFRQYEQELSRVLGGLYERLNAMLSAAGFHADMRGDQAPARPVPATAPASPAATAPASQPAAAASADIDLFRTSAEARVRHQHLRELLHAWRESSPPAQPASEQRPAHAMGGERRELRTEELLSVASLLQQENHAPFDRALSGDGDLRLAIREQMLEGARRLGVDTDRSCLARHEEDAIDLVGLLFQSLLQTHVLQPQPRRLYARLVMAYVRIALIDDNLFVRSDHPGRRLLDALTQSCESNDGASPQDRELLRRAGEVVARVVAEYNEDLAIFELAANELQDLLQQQRSRAEIVERRWAETVYGRERLLQARLQAAGELRQRAAGQPLTATVAQFLEQHWQHHLVQTLLRDGHGSRRYHDVLALADALVAVDQAAGRGDGGEVADRVWSLHGDLVACLSSSGLDDQVASEWLAGLARTMAFPDTPRDVQSLPDTPQLADDGEDTRLLRVVGGTATLEFDPQVAERLRQLNPGAWLRLVDEDGQEGSVKLAWISPLTSRLLLVNRRGVRKLVASPQQLAVLVKAGRLLVETAAQPFDEAMRQVRERLSGALSAASAA